MLRPSALAYYTLHYKASDARRAEPRLRHRVAGVFPFCLKRSEATKRNPVSGLFVANHSALGQIGSTKAAIVFISTVRRDEKDDVL